MSLAAESVKLAFWTANRFHAPDRAGIESAALLGLMRAEADFDPDRGSFAAWAVMACRHAVWKEVLRQRRASDHETSLFVVGEDGDEIERRDLPSVAPVDGSGLMAARLREVLADLDPREREVVTRRFGLDGPEETLQAIGDALGLSRHRVGQIEKRALGRLRRALSRRRR